LDTDPIFDIQGRTAQSRQLKIQRLTTRL